MQMDEDATQRIAAIGPLDEKTVDQHLISFGFSLQIITREGLSVRGDAHMQRTRTGIPQRASRPADTDDLSNGQQLGAMPRSVIRWRPINQATAGQDVTATTTTAPQPTTTRTTAEQLASKQGHKFSRMWFFLLPALVVVLFFTALPGLERQWHRGDHGTQVWTINGDTFTAWTDNDAVDILVYPHGDKSHAQLVPSRIIGSHTSSVTIDLMQQENSVLVFLNNTQVGHLVPDGKGGYTWQ